LQYWNFDPTKKDEGKKDGKAEEKEPAERVVQRESLETGSHPSPKEKSESSPAKKIPVFFLDEAHKLPALVPDEDAIKMLLDSMLPAVRRSI
jgi:hypothetical protein